MTGESLDHILDEFEEQWSKTANPPDLQFYLGQVDGSRKAELATGLIEIDLERRWRSGGSVSPIGVAEYLSQFPGLSLSESAIESLLESEFVVRCEFGDCPPIPEFTGTTLCDSDSLRTKLLRRRSAVNWPIVRLIADAECVLEVPLDRVTEIGRQDRNDPPPVTTLDQDECRRVIIAASSDASISRRQLVLRLVRSDRIEVTNLSSNRAVAVRGQTALSGGQAAVCPLPVRMSLTSTSSITITR